MVAAMNRRQSIGTIAGAVVATVAATRVSSAQGKKPALTPVAPGGHKPVPLPFNPAKLPGLSEKLLTSHHDNNYAGAVKNLNAVEPLAGRAQVTGDHAKKSHRSDPQTHVAESRMIASVGARMVGAGSSSARTSRAP